MKPFPLLFIDIETVPLVASFHDLSETMQHLWQKKSTLYWPDEDVAITFSERAGIYAEFGKVVCIGLGYFVTENNSLLFRCKTLQGHDEKMLLQEFSETCKQYFKLPGKQFCGHNIREFDLPYLCRRMLVLSKLKNHGRTP
jgi:3'-5' exonuclease